MQATQESSVLPVSAVIDVVQGLEEAATTESEKLFWRSLQSGLQSSYQREGFLIRGNGIFDRNIPERTAIEHLAAIAIANGTPLTEAQIKILDSRLDPQVSSAQYADLSSRPYVAFELGSDQGLGPYKSHVDSVRRAFAAGSGGKIELDDVVSIPLETLPPDGMVALANYYLREGQIPTFNFSNTRDIGRLTLQEIIEKFGLPENTTWEAIQSSLDIQDAIIAQLDDDSQEILREYLSTVALHPEIRIYLGVGNDFDRPSLLHVIASRHPQIVLVGGQFPNGEPVDYNLLNTDPRIPFPVVEQWEPALVVSDTITSKTASPPEFPVTTSPFGTDPKHTFDLYNGADVTVVAASDQEVDRLARTVQRYGTLVRLEALQSLLQHSVSLEDEQNFNEYKPLLSQILALSPDDTRLSLQTIIFSNAWRLRVLQALEEEIQLIPSVEETKAELPSLSVHGLQTQLDSHRQVFGRGKLQNIDIQLETNDASTAEVPFDLVEATGLARGRLYSASQLSDIMVAYYNYIPPKEVAEFLELLQSRGDDILYQLTFENVRPSVESEYLVYGGKVHALVQGTSFSSPFGAGRRAAELLEQGQNAR